jgi:DNA polymerase III alpha subunit
MDGLNSPDELAKQAKILGHACNCHYRSWHIGHLIVICKLLAKNYGVKPILGVEAYISPTDRFDRSSFKDKSVQAYNHIITFS